MLQACNQEDLSYDQLQATYRSEWRAFAQETRQWRSLEDAKQSRPDSIREAKFLAEAAEHRYRRARNKLWEHIVLHSRLESLAIAQTTELSSDPAEISG
jgi:hypothetical protein